MQKSIIILGIITLFAAAVLAAGHPIIMEMPMTEAWENLPDTPTVTVMWNSDDCTLLAVSGNGMDLLQDQNIHAEMLDEYRDSRDYYIVSSRSRDLPEDWSGILLKSGHFLIHVEKGTILPANPDLGYQRIRLTDRMVSSLIPKPYSGYASRDHSPLIQSYVDQVEGTYLHQLLEQMVGFVTRYSSTPQCNDAIAWAADQFEGWGYDVELVPHTSGMAPNLIATKYGAINPDRIWVVGGHFDSTSPTPSTLAPGADDNGTGSALTMCCANLLKDLQFGDTVIYALWTGEEQGLYGSDFWATWAAGEGLDIQGYYNFDMIGWVDPYPEDLEVLVNNASLSFGQDFVDVTAMYTSLPYNLQVSSVSASDHYSFWQQGYASFCAIEDYWPTYPYYHTVNDTVDKVDIPFLTDVTKAMVANICTAAELSEVIAFEQPMINCNGILDLFVIDFDASGSISVNVHSDTEMVPETVFLPEFTAYVFKGMVPLTDSAPAAGDGMISVTHGDSVIAEYAGVSQNASVSVDCIAPIISNLSVSDVTSTSVTIHFDTNETTIAQIRYGEIAPETVIDGEGSSLSHTITITDLNDCTLYYFEVEVTDAAGNSTIDNAGGSYHSFMTLERVVMLQENMDANPGWTYENQWAWGIPSGSGGDPSSGYTGSHVVGYNLSGAYANNMPETNCTTPSIDCSDASVVILGYYHWLGVESSQWDHASVRVSGNGGSTWTTIWNHDGSSLQPSSWSYSEFDISSVAAGSTNVRVRWVMGTTDTSVVYCGWNIDDVTIFFERPCDQVTPTPTPDICMNTGDVNLDTEITAGDAQMAFQIALGTISPTVEEACAADCNADETVTAGDAQAIFMTALGSASCVDPLLIIY